MTLFLRSRSATVFLFLFLITLRAPAARADASIGDSALTVAFATIGGAVMGASTLPFYDEPGEHTKNIFYGAALGAVAGVLISAYAGVKEGPDYSDDEAALHRRPSALSLNEAPELRLRPQPSSAMPRQSSFASGTTLAWSQLASVRF